MSPAVDGIAAVHEAAHACYAQMRGWDVKEAVLHAVGARQDEIGHTALHETDRERDHDPLGFAIFLLVAGAAERRQTGTISARCSADYELARHLCSVNLNQDLDSDAVAQEMATVEALAYAAVQDERFWGWVNRTAPALIRRRRLTHYDIHQLREAQR